jgi:3-hydroxyisobutyrate dehydrogenase-like beta-hydroxyacid dehydrogenase
MQIGYIGLGRMGSMATRVRRDLGLFVKMAV